MGNGQPVPMHFKVSGSAAIVNMEEQAKMCVWWGGEGAGEKVRGRKDANKTWKSDWKTKLTMQESGEF